MKTPAIHTCIVAALCLSAACHKTKNTTVIAPADSTLPATQPTQQIHTDTAIVKHFAGVEITDFWEILPTTDTVNSRRHTDSTTFTITRLGDGRTIIYSAQGLRLLGEDYDGINDTFTTNSSEIYTSAHCTFQLQDNTFLATWDNTIAVPLHSDVSDESQGQYTGYRK